MHAVYRFFLEKYLEARKNRTRIGKVDLELRIPGLRRDQKIFSIEFEKSDQLAGDGPQDSAK